MPVFVVTGKLGGGKSLMCVNRMKEALEQGRPIATNLNLNLEVFCGKYAKKTVAYRVPDRPMARDLELIGLGYEGKKIDESKNGVLVLDECATWLNSRNFKDAGRQDLIDYLIHARKRRWDVYFIIQDIEVLDKQARKLFAEHVVYCRRTDRFSIPFISFFYKLITSTPLPLPKLHVGFVKYGCEHNSPQVDKWFCRGTGLYDAYDTEQIFTEQNTSTYQLLPTYFTTGRYTNKLEDFKNDFRNFKIKGLHAFLVGAFSAAFITNAAVTFLPEEPKKGMFTCNATYKELYGSCDAAPVLTDEKELVAKIRSLKSGAVVDKALLPGKEEIINVEVPGDKIIITGSVKHTSGFDYLFTKNDIPYHPRDAGSKVRWISPCKAIIMKDKVSITVYCSDVAIEGSSDSA